MGGGEPQSTLVGKMIDALGHRGPDGRRVALDAGGRVCLAMATLAIVSNPDNLGPRRSNSGRWLVAVKGDAGHRRPVPVMVVGSPTRVTRQCILGSQGVFKKWVAAVDAGVEDAGCRGVVGGRLGPSDEVVGPLGLLDLG